MFSEEYARFWDEFGSGRTMVLATAQDEEVSARMMSVVAFEGKLCFQTDRTFRKYAALRRNPHAALCIDNISIEGTVEEIGAPSVNPGFLTHFSASFPGSFKSYSGLHNEVVFALTPRRIERWLYLEGQPFIEVFDVICEAYSLTPYHGI